MKQTDLNNGFVLLTAPNVVKDIRNGQVYSEAEVKTEDVKYFVEA